MLETNMPALSGNDQDITIANEMSRSFASYAMSVVVSRALPDVRDGLKPVHRRVVYAMKTGGFSASDAHKKSARVVGDVMGKFHPHGDAAIYEAMVRMGQSFKMSVPLIDGQGNFGSIDGDPPAAMRYTESRLSGFADLALGRDLEEDAVDFVPNYDGSEMEPTCLAARVPNILINGGEGIAVGMATDIPPHNLREVVNLALAYMDNPRMSIEEAMQILPGPDFPTGGVIFGTAGIELAYRTGRGRAIVSGVYRIEKNSRDRESIIITEIPYGVNKKTLVSNMGELVNDKTIEGVSDIRDESDENIRIVVDIKRDADAQVVLSKLLRHTQLRTSIPFNMTCLSSRREPKQMGILEMMEEFISFRRSVIRRRTAFRMEERRNALERQMSLYAARSRVDDVVRVIRGSADTQSARNALLGMEFPTAGEFKTLLSEVDPDVEAPDVFTLTPQGADIILRMQLSSLTAIQQERVAEEARSILQDIRVLQNILENSDVLDDIIRHEMVEVRDKYDTPRRTVIEAADPDDISEDDLVEDRQVILTLTRGGYVKRTMLDAYREQARGGKGKSGMDMKDTDVVCETLVCSTRSPLLVFTDKGIAHVIKAWKFPDAPPNARGRHISNFLKLAPGEGIATVMPLPEADAGRFMVFVTDIGEVRRNNAADFADIRGSGKIAMKMEGTNARLIAVLDADEGDDVVLSTRRGKCVRFPLTDLRVFAGRSSTGVRGITLGHEDKVISASLLRTSSATTEERRAYLGGDADENEENKGEFVLSEARRAELAAEEQFLLTVTAQGYGKRFSSHDLRSTSRGAQGVFLGSFEKTGGELIACFPVTEGDNIVIVSNTGRTIRTNIEDVRVMGRLARGVRLFDLPEGERIADVARVPQAQEQNA
jgi:DNA gyrase subunit A